ncbi:5'-methylthioadenosine/adenosylhomocysteine nucleosidase [Bacillaceae bacterium W0354]
MTIGIIGAMEQEVDALLSHMTVTEEITVANCKFYKGKINKTEVVLLQSGIGKVNAALSTTILHERFKPSAVINTGSAGGTDIDLDVGDLVIGESVMHHDADATAFGYEYGQIPQMPHLFKSDEQMIQVAKETAKEVNKNIKVGVGTIGTGDSFMAEERRVKDVLERLPFIKALEMEAASIAQVCYQYGTPFLIIRSLSDIAGKESNVSFEKFLETAAQNSANLIIQMLNHL